MVKKKVTLELTSDQVLDIMTGLNLLICDSYGDLKTFESISKSITEQRIALKNYIMTNFAAAEEVKDENKSES